MVPPHQEKLIPFEWEKTYLNAVLETDEACISEKIRDAERAIAARMAVLSTLGVGATEFAHLEMAVSALGVLKRERLNSGTV